MSGQQLYNTPLLKKIGAKENQHLLVLNPPSFIRELLIGEKLVFQTQGAGIWFKITPIDVKPARHHLGILV